MWYDNLFIEVEALSDKQQAEKMAAYMQNKFVFLGIPKPKLRAVVKPYLKNASKTSDIDWDFVKLCWNKEYREAQYIALEYLKHNKKKLVKSDLNRLKCLAVNRSWWETCDNLDALIGELVLKYPELKREMIIFSTSDNIWLRRIAIDYQQKYKELTDTEQLEKIICNNLNTNEFFIDKAIGWSLRDYSKTNLEWVRKFVNNHKDELAKLSIREASKNF